MTTELDIVNRALQTFGSRTNVASLNEQSNEAINANLILHPLRDQLIRMAPWNCVTKFQNLVYVTSTPTTPENPASGPPFWQSGMPAPPWSYEYQYPVDCLRARYLIPQYTALSGGVPIYPPGTATGAMQVGWTGPALKFNVTTDQFFGVTSATPAVGGSGYAVNDIVTLVQPTFPLVQTVQGITTTTTMNVGAPAQLQVLTAPGGVIATVGVVNQVQGESTAIGGSYFSVPANPVAQGSTSGVGTGATFNLTFGPLSPQRVILCNQEMAILCYNTQITDPNIMDPAFQEAWVAILGARLCVQLTSDKALANQSVALANSLIMEARKSDGNEDITVNDITPDFLRIRGNWGGPNWEYSPNFSFDWGSSYSPY